MPIKTEPLYTQSDDILVTDKDMSPTKPKIFQVEGLQFSQLPTTKSDISVGKNAVDIPLFRDKA